MVYLKCI